MADDSLKLEVSLASMLASLSPSARKSVLKDIADRLRDTNRKRIAGQIGPDGQPFPPRLRQKKGRIPRGGAPQKAVYTIMAVLRQPRPAADCAWGRRCLLWPVFLPFLHAAFCFFVFRSFCTHRPG